MLCSWEEGEGDEEEEEELEEGLAVLASIILTDATALNKSGK
jgi:hypothetical protein